MEANCEKPVISVVMPVYNAEAFLDESVGSVLSQSYGDFELICFNDASTDGSLDKLRGYESADPRVVVIDSPVNVKQGGGRNRGLRQARGRYVMFLDADDKLAEDALKDCMDAVAAKDADAVFFDYFRFKSESADVVAVSQLGADAEGFDGEQLRRRILRNTTPVWSALYRRELIVDNDLFFPEGVFYEDNAVALAMQLSASRPVKINRAVYGYRCDNFSVTRSEDNPRFFDRIASAEMLLGHCRRLGLYERYKPEIDFVFINQYLVNTVYGAIYRFRKVQVDKIRYVRGGIGSILPDYRRNVYYRRMMLGQRLKLYTHMYFPRVIKLMSNVKRRLAR